MESSSGAASVPSTSGALCRSFSRFAPRTERQLTLVYTALPSHSRPLVPFTNAVRALRVSSGPPTTTSLPPSTTLPLLPPDHRHHQPPPPPYSSAHVSSVPPSPSSKTSLPPAVPPRPTFRNQVPPLLSPDTDASRQPFMPVPPTPPRRRPLPMSQSAPALPGRVGQPVWSRAPDERGAGLSPHVDVPLPMRSGFAYSNGSATLTPPPRPRPYQQGSPHPYTASSSKSFPAAQPRPLSPDENELPPPHTIGRAIASRASPQSPTPPKPSPTTPVRKAPRRASEPVRSSNSPASARSSPASSRRGAGQSRQCDGITALSKRCTRMVSLAAWAIPAGGVDLAGLDELAGEGAGGPVYCKQHAKLVLVDSGCFVTVRSGDGASQERWISFSGEFPAQSSGVCFTVLSELNHSILACRLDRRRLADRDAGAAAALHGETGLAA